MRALDQSDELLQRGAELRARSVRIHAAAAGKMEKSRRLIAAAAKADEAVLQAHDWSRPGAGGEPRPLANPQLPG